MTTNEQTFTRRVGQNIQELRKAAGMTQTQLAEELAERGFPFRQQTVLKVEKGQRPLKLEEAVAVAGALDVSVDTLLEEAPMKRDATAMVLRWTTEVHERIEALREATFSLVKGLDHLRFFVESSGEEADSYVATTAVTALGHDPVAVVEGAIKELAGRES